MTGSTGRSRRRCPARLTGRRISRPGTRPPERLRDWARSCFGPSLPALTLGPHAVIALNDAGLWGDLVANLHWALGHLMLADDPQRGLARLLLVLWTCDAPGGNG
ncbi:hypothetical protein [Nonomuraea sp. NPDC049709]|uniref:hypothetical protein n=1 Tax=Nonomuraea sp. NPDC049709 TaxID=3154736 RepID=UPI0034442163